MSSRHQQPTSLRSENVKFIIPALQLGVLVIILTYCISLVLPAQLGRIDFAQYWAAAKLFAFGQNPYSPLLIKEAQAPLAGLPPLTILMWNPPWILPIITPLALMPFDTAVSLFFVLGIIMVLQGLRLELLAFPNVWSSRFSIVFSLAFLGSFHAWRESLFYGQISCVVFLGLCVFLRQYRHGYSGRFGVWAAAAGLALTLIKPHAIFLLYVYLFFEALENRSTRRVLLCCTAILGTSLMIAQLWQPQLLSWYFEAWQSPPIYWKTPTIGSWLQENSGVNRLWMRILPSGIATLCCVWLCLRRNNKKEDLDTLLPLSLLCSPYTWGYDHLLLLPSCLSIMNFALHPQLPKSWFASSALLALLGANLVRVFCFPVQTMEQLVWYPALVVLLVQLKPIKR